MHPSLLHGGSNREDHISIGDLAAAIGWSARFIEVLVVQSKRKPICRGIAILTSLPS